MKEDSTNGIAPHAHKHTHACGRTHPHTHRCMHTCSAWWWW